MTDRTPLPIIRHSKDLIEAIKKAHSLAPDLVERYGEGKWYVMAGEAVLSGPSDSQWDAWMEAAYGPSRTD